MLFLGGNEHSVKVSSNSEMVRAGVPFENFGDYRELILNREEQHFCIVCNLYKTVKHILTNRIHFSEVINKYFQVTDLIQLFKDVSVDSILSFLTNINLINKL